MNDNSENCQNYYADFENCTFPDLRKALPLRRYWWLLKRYAWYVKVLGLFKFLKRLIMFKFFKKKAYKNKQEIAQAMKSSENQNFQPGDFVEVRSENEVFETLDKDGKLKGLRFTPEMRKFCGKKYRVYKKIEKIIVEATGELRTLKTPSYILEEVFCDGSAHGGCDRSCFIFWRDEWLKRASTHENS